MQSFLIALILILIGGVGPLFLWPRFSVMKGVGVLAMVAGCVVGLKEAFSILTNADTLSVSFDYLNTFSLSFQIDPLLPTSSKFHADSPDIHMMICFYLAVKKVNNSSLGFRIFTFRETGTY